MKKSERVWITAYLLICMFFLSAVFAVQGSLLSTMIEQFHLSAASQGTANTMAFTGGIAALVCAFAMQGRWQKRTLLRISVLICALGLALMWLAPGYGLYTAAWFIAGFGLGLMDTLLSACMADLYTGRMAVMMMCFLHTSYGLSSVLSPMGYSALLSAGTAWKVIYLLLGAAGIMIILCALLIRKAGGMVDREPTARTRPDLRGILPALKQGKLLWLIAALFFHGIFLSGLNTWSNRFADTVNAAITLPAQSCVFLGVMLSRMLMPFLPIRAEKYVAVSGFAAGAALVVGLLIPNGWVLRVMLIISSLLFGALIPCLITLGCERQREKTLLVTTGIMLALYLGQAVSAPMIAALEAAFGLRWGIGLCAVSMVLCSLCCVADAAGMRRSESD